MTLWPLYRRDAEQDKRRSEPLRVVPCVSVCVISVYRKVAPESDEGYCVDGGDARLRTSIASPSDCPGTIVHVL